MEKWIEVAKKGFWDGVSLFPESIRVGRFLIIGSLVGGMVLLILLTILLNRVYKKSKYEKELQKISFDILNAAKLSTNRDKFIDQCLDIVCRSFEAQSYGFYLYDPKSEAYVLKGVRYSREDLNEVGPSYSGLVPYKKEQYIQPVSVPNQDIPGKTSIISDGKVPLLVIPFENKNAMVRIFPVKKLQKKIRLKLDHFSKMAGVVFDVMSETDAIKSKIKTVVASDSAVDRVVNTLGTEDGLLYALIGLCIKKTGADSGFFIKKEEELLKPFCFVSLPAEFQADIVKDDEGIKSMFALSDQNDIVQISKKQPNYYKLPPYFTIHQIESVVFLKVENNEETGTMVLLFREGNTSQNFDVAKMKGVQYAKNKFQEIFGVQNIIKSLSESFQGTLQGLIQLIDNIQPYTVGYSELMARFSYIIADELGLPGEEKKDIYLAAYLSNIGVLGLSNDIFFKTGKYSDIEYEAMKFHAEAGARIIEASLGSKRVADYVRYHHERMDGLGYPTGLKGNDIPLGARIIAVVQFFLAKINGREGRDPVSFNDALKSLEMSCDTQLDRDCVAALNSWITKKRHNNPSKERSLGYCWDMRCSTLEICMDCPVYMKENVNCWDYEDKGIKCSEHGNACQTCYIRTEVLGR